MAEAKVMRQHIALALLRTSRNRYAEYDAEVEAWHRDPETRKYRFPTCIHGNSLWVDHDIPCGACEDGDGRWDYLRELGYAWEEANTRVDEYHERWEHIRPLRDAGAPKEPCKALMDWMWDRLMQGTTWPEGKKK